MRIHIETETPTNEPPRVGNVYAVKGGRGMSRGHMNILIAITDAADQFSAPMGLMLTVDKTGKPRGVTSYGMHYINDLSPIAFVDGIEEMDLTMRSL